LWLTTRRPQVVPFVGKNFNLVVPIFTLVIAVLHVLNLLNRMLQASIHSLRYQPDRLHWTMGLSLRVPKLPCMVIPGPEECHTLPKFYGGSRDSSFVTGFHHEISSSAHDRRTHCLHS
jgi:hypothetical protein